MVTTRIRDLVTEMGWTPQVDTAYLNRQTDLAGQQQFVTHYQPGDLHNPEIHERVYEYARRVKELAARRRGE